MKPKPVPASAPAALSPGLRRFLYLTAATTGAAVLIVEILGAKMLAPYLGTSHFVWTAQIAVTLLSLATGYWFGGWLVDRSPRLGRLYACILGAAAYLACTIPACAPVAYACLKFNLATGSILASLFLFFLPLTLLAAVGPFLIRVLTQSVNTVGSQVGRLSAISTLGSVLGTVLIGYVLIPLLPNSVTMYLTSGLLMLLWVAHYVGWGRQQKQGAAGSITTAVLGLLIGGVSIAADGPVSSGYGKEIFRCNSDFGLLQVMKNPATGYRYYLNDYLTQNGYDPATKQSIYLFTYMLHRLAHCYASKMDNVLCIGMGIGIVPMQFAREGVRTDIVEINPAVVPVAQQFFDFDPSKVNLNFGDGREFINRATNQYDAIILDAFLGDSSPSHLMSREAFAGMSRLLKPGGVLVINSFGNFEAKRDFYVSSLHKTLKASFGAVRIHCNPYWGNVFFVATNDKELVQHHPPLLDHVHPKLGNEAVAGAFDGIRETDPRSGIVLTDDYNPADAYDAENRQEIRRSLAFHMREKNDED